MILKDIKNSLLELGLSENGVRVYLALAKLGEAKAAQIAKLADIPRTTAISILINLEKEHLITSHIYKGVTTYWIESPQVILDVLNTKLDVAKQLKISIPELYHAQGSFPVARIFDTKSGIKAFIKRVLEETPKGSIIYTIDTPHEGNYAKIFPEGVGGFISKIKEEKRIITKTLIPAGSHGLIQKNKIGSQNIQIKEMPELLHFSAAFWIIDNKLFIFSGNPPFLVAIQHKAIVDGYQGLFDFLWEISVVKHF